MFQLFKDVHAIRLNQEKFGSVCAEVLTELKEVNKNLAKLIELLTPPPEVVGIGVDVGAPEPRP
jgi:hypothetical protein